MSADFRAQKLTVSYPLLIWLSAAVATAKKVQKWQPRHFAMGIMVMAKRDVKWIRFSQPSSSKGRPKEVD